MFVGAVLGNSRELLLLSLGVYSHTSCFGAANQVISNSPTMTSFCVRKSLFGVFFFLQKKKTKRKKLNSKLGLSKRLRSDADPGNAAADLQPEMSSGSMENHPVVFTTTN